MSEHWYTREGKSAYTTNGRDTTLRDARKAQLVPSVTTILGVIAKPALETWKVNQGIMAALTGTREGGESDTDYIARILRESKQSAIDAANEGTRIHDACETYVKHGHCRDEYFEHAQAAYKELQHLFPQVDDWVCEKSFAHPLGFGGKVDLHSPSTGIVADYKTKDGDFSDGKKLGWDQHWQLAPYAIGLGILPWNEMSSDSDPDDPVLNKRWPEFKPGAAIFISRTHPGKVASFVWRADEMAQGWRVFAGALALHKLLKSYDGSWT